MAHHKDLPPCKGKLVEAEQVGREFLEIAEKLRSPHAIRRASTWLTLILFDFNKWDEALRYADRAIKFEIGSSQLMGVSALQFSGLIAAARGDDDVARERIAALEAAPTPVPPEHTGARQQALDIALWLDDRTLLTRLLIMIGTLLTNRYRIDANSARAGWVLSEHRGAPADFVYSRNALHQENPEAWLRGASEDPSVGWARSKLEAHIRDEHSTFSWLLEPMLQRAGVQDSARGTQIVRPHWNSRLICISVVGRSNATAR